MVNPSVVLLSGAEHLKKEIEQLNLQVFTSHKNYDNKRLFPNADIYTRLGDLEEIVTSEKVVVIQGGSYMLGGERQLMSPADFVFETIQALDILSKPMTTKEVAHKKYEYHQLRAPKHLQLLFTFFPFSLQDKIFQTGEAASASIVYNTLSRYIEKMGIIDLHAPPTVPWVKKGSSTGKLDLLTMTDYLIKEAIDRYDLNHPI
ncbi:MAG: hypothetical protein ACW976_02415, partial [Candidatus Ranarchaeia archaeon]